MSRPSTRHWSSTFAVSAYIIASIASGILGPVLPWLYGDPFLGFVGFIGPFVIAAMAITLVRWPLVKRRRKEVDDLISAAESERDPSLLLDAAEQLSIACALFGAKRLSPLHTRLDSASDALGVSRPKAFQTAPSTMPKFPDFWSLLTDGQKPIDKIARVLLVFGLILLAYNWIELPYLGLPAAAAFLLQWVSLSIFLRRFPPIVMIGGGFFIACAVLAFSGVASLFIRSAVS